MKQALLAVSFGTSVATARESISAVERALSGAAPERDFFRAFTSPTIRRIWQRRGEVIASMEEALEQLAADGYDDVIVQPTHLLYGIEYDRMAAEAHSFAPRFEKFTLGAPLVANNDDLLSLAACIEARHVPASPDHALVLVGHGTPHYANMVYPALQTALRLDGVENAFVGTVEGWPDVDAVLRQLAASQYRRATLVPLMLVAGDHALNDMAGDEPDSWKSRLEAVGICVDCHMQGLGLLDGVQRMYAAHLRERL